KKEEYQALVDTGHGDLIPDAVKPLDRPKVPLTPAQIARVEGRKNAWMTFKYGLMFRVWRAITGDNINPPPVGTIAQTGRPKNGTLPQDYMVSYLGLQLPLQTVKHKTAFAVIAEMYSITPVEIRPDGKLWETLVLDADNLIEKWCGAQDPFFKMTFPDALKTARMEKRWTQGELADTVGFQSLAVSRWERGEYEPSAQAVYEIAKYMPRMKIWFREHLEWLKAHGVPGI